MAVHDLSGAGVIAVTPGTTHLFVDVLVFGANLSTGSAIPTDYFHLGALRLGVNGSYYHVQYIDAASMIIDVPPNVNVLGYSCHDVTSIRVTEA